MLKIEDIENKIINADCLDILKQLPDNSLSCIFTDPPYKQEYRTSIGTNKTITRKNYSKIGDYGSNSKLNYNDLFELCIKKLKQINFFTFCDKETKYEFITLAKKYDFGYKELCFCKTSPTPFTNNQWLPDVEFGLHIFKDLPVMGDYSTKRSFFIMPNFKEEYIEHPTPKKVKIVEQILKNITNEKDLVLDCFSGSGTTALACHNLNRRFICIEKNKEYWQKSVERLQIAQAQQKLNLQL